MLPLQTFFTEQNGDSSWTTPARGGSIYSWYGEWTGPFDRCWMRPRRWKGSGPGVLGSGRIQSPGWIPHHPLGKPSTTSPWHMPSWREGSSGNGSRPAWRGHANRGSKSVGQRCDRQARLQTPFWSSFGAHYRGNSVQTPGSGGAGNRLCNAETTPGLRIPKLRCAI